MTDASASSVPLCVDLDGTLIAGDLNRIATLAMLRRKPWMLFALLLWALQGRPAYKRHLERHVTLDPASLPYFPDVLRSLEEQHALGRRIILATASRKSMVTPIARRFPFFDETVVATEDGKNLSGANKADVLVGMFGEKGFDYMGNEWRDIAIWRHARKAYVVHAPRSVEQAARKLGNVERVFS